MVVWPLLEFVTVVVLEVGVVGLRLKEELPLGVEVTRVELAVWVARLKLFLIELWI
jgi:hypothetical protein